ncbi:lantibiotic dehydratase C-terminal domain-containing protein [Streptomyces coeruleorubidus]|uniref:lantibiotic dehydratase C-terminal domain-containing protein n=1 Tax=Streptomyces coeruleorubidus TaxID=116188 RepID=UPI00380450FA
MNRPPPGTAREGRRAGPGICPGTGGRAEALLPLRRHDEILSGPLRALADAPAPRRTRRPAIRSRPSGAPTIRYAAPRPLTELLAFGRHMVRRGLVGDLEIASYEPEVVRYGGPRVHDSIERLFEAGSDIALQDVDRMRGGSVGAEETAARSL